jgi:hypothetical protein
VTAGKLLCSSRELHPLFVHRWKQLAPRDSSESLPSNANIYEEYRSVDEDMVCMLQRSLDLIQIQNASDISPGFSPEGELGQSPCLRLNSIVDNRYGTCVPTTGRHTGSRIAEFPPESGAIVDPVH